MTGAGLAAAEARAIVTAVRFESFDDFWLPFTLGAGPAPAYCMSLPPDERSRLRERLESELGGGPIELPARAWAVRARAP